MVELYFMCVVKVVYGIVLMKFSKPNSVIFIFLTCSFSVCCKCCVKNSRHVFSPQLVCALASSLCSYILKNGDEQWWPFVPGSCSNSMQAQCWKASIIEKKAGNVYVNRFKIFTDNQLKNLSTTTTVWISCISHAALNLRFCEYLGLQFRLVNTCCGGDMFLIVTRKLRNLQPRQLGCLGGYSQVMICLLVGFWVVYQARPSPICMDADKSDPTVQSWDSSNILASVM